MRKLPDRWPTNLEKIAADPDNIVGWPEQTGLRFPFIIYGGGKAIGEAFGEWAKERREREALQRKEKSATLQADCQVAEQDMPVAL